MQKGGNGGKIKAMEASHYFIVCKVALLGVSDHCVKNQTKCMPYPHEYIYIYIYLKSYGLDYISCTGFVRVMGYKYLLLDAHTITALLSCRRREGGIEELLDVGNE